MTREEADSYFADLRDMLTDFGAAPSYEDMPRRKLEDKGINGPTAAHVIEEVHVPFNYEGITFTTGSSSFQNIVGITHAEMPLKMAATRKVLDLCGAKHHDRMLVCYPPLVNVFSKKALLDYEISWFFMHRSSRDAFLCALYFGKPDIVIGESMFIKFALDDAQKLGVDEFLPSVREIMTAGAPMDLELPEKAKKILNADVHDVYGCQEFGWLTVDGIPVREDISLIPSHLGKDYRELVVGGLPMGDSFPCSLTGSHVLSNAGKIITYRRQRTKPDYEVIVRETPLNSRETLERATRTILRTKSRMVIVHPGVKLGAEKTVLWLKSVWAPLEEGKEIVIAGPLKTQCFDALVQAQIDFQENSVSDPAWIKRG